MTIKVDELTTRRVAELSHARDVEAVAPVIRVRLVAPVGVTAVVNAASALAASDIHAVGPDTLSFSDDGVTVVVLDTGIDWSHEAFTGVELVRRNFTSEVDDDIRGHGIHCAGTIFGRNVAEWRIGVAPRVRKALIGKVLGQYGG